MPKISALPPATIAGIGDLLVLDQGLVTKRIDFNILQSSVANAGVVQSLIQQAVLAPLPVPVPIASGGTAAVTAAAARASLDVVQASALSGASGSTLVGFIQAGGGASTRTSQDKGRERVSSQDFGVVGDGVADDTTAFNLARTAALGKTLLILGTPLISSALTLAAREHWVFDGPVGNAASGRPGSYLIKKSTLNAALVTFVSGSDGSLIERGGIVGQVGNGGDGYVIRANGVQLSRPYVTLMGNDGIRIGSDTSGTNANEFDLQHPVCISNVRHGIYIFDDNSSDTIDANAGVIHAPFCQTNGGDGIKVEKGDWNTIIAPGLEGNTGSGLRLTSSGCFYTTVVGGDIEGNAEDITIGSNAANNILIGVNYTTFSDAGISSLFLGPVKTKLPILAYTFADGGGVAPSAFAANDTTPSVLGKTCWQTSNGSSTTITNFDDGVNGQQIIVRLDNNTGITTGGNFVLKATIAVGGADSNKFICLMRLSSIWFEMFRSF